MATRQHQRRIITNYRPLSNAEKQLRRAKRRRRKAANAKIRREKYLLDKNRRFGKFSKEQRASHFAKIDYQYVRAPDILSFLRNPSEFSYFITCIQECFSKKYSLWVVLKDVTVIDHDAITVLLSAVVRFQSQNIRFNGNFPKDPEVRKILEESGFFHHLFKKRYSEKDEYTIKSKTAILTHAQKNVDSELSAEIIEECSKIVWGEPRRCPGLQRTFIELMQNTNNHASLEREGEKHWWLSVEKNEKSVAFAFVDYGVGVFHNLQNKKQGSRFYKILEKIREKLTFGNNGELLSLIFRGDLHRTASGNYYRGKGLPGIYDAFIKNSISNLCMVTNDVFYQSEENNYSIMENSFSGTFVRFELNETNESLPYEN